MMNMLVFHIRRTRDDSAGGDDFGRQRLFQLLSEIPGLPRQKLACRGSLRFGEPLQNR